MFSDDRGVICQPELSSGLSESGSEFRAMSHAESFFSPLETSEHPDVTADEASTCLINSG